MALVLYFFLAVVAVFAAIAAWPLVSGAFHGAKDEANNDGLSKARLTGVVATLWAFFALFSVFVALTLSPMGLRLLLPSTHPSTWIYPALLVIPPSVLLCQRFLSMRVAQVLLWCLSLALGAFTLLLVAFTASFFFWR